MIVEVSTLFCIARFSAVPVSSEVSLTFLLVAGATVPAYVPFAVATFVRLCSSVVSGPELLSRFAACPQSVAVQVAAGVAPLQVVVFSRIGTPAAYLRLSTEFAAIAPIVQMTCV